MEDRSEQQANGDNRAEQIKTMLATKGFTAEVIRADDPGSKLTILIDYTEAFNLCSFLQFRGGSVESAAKHVGKSAEAFAALEAEMHEADTSWYHQDGV